MPIALRRYTKFVLWVLAICLPALVSAQEDSYYQEDFYYLEVGGQAGAAYYAGELAPHAFMSMGETYGLQMRCKVDRRWALQVKGQRQRVVNTLEAGNEWGVRAGRYQVPMWHFDVTGEYNFFNIGWESYGIRVKRCTPFVFVGLGMTVHNLHATIGDTGYPQLLVKNERQMDYAMYVPVGVGVKLKLSERWQLQFAWQHNLYVKNGDGLEGGGKRGESPFNDSYSMNGGNVMNNDLTSTLTVGIVFEFAPGKQICTICPYSLYE